MKNVNYSAMEKTIIRDCVAMGYSNTDIAAFLNKKEHAHKSVRTAEAIRKQIYKMKK